MTRPATPPYSSRTMAIWLRRARNSFEQVVGVLGLGDEVGRADRACGGRPRRGRRRRSSAGRGPWRRGCRGCRRGSRRTSGSGSGPDSRKVRAACRAEVVAGRTTIDERGRHDLGDVAAGQGDDVLEDRAGRLGQVGLGVLGVVGVGLELDLDAGGPRRGVGRPGEPVGERPRPARRPRSAAQAATRTAAAIGQRASSRVSAQTRPTTLAARWTRTARPDGEQQRQLEVQARGASSGPPAPTQGGEGQAADDRQRLGGALGRLVVVGDRVGPLGAAVGLADLLEAAPRVGPQGPAERDQDRLESPAGRARGRAARPGSARPTQHSPAPRRRPRRADQGERVDQALGGQDLPFPAPHRARRPRASGRRGRRGGASRGPRRGPARPAGRRPTSRAVAAAISAETTSSPAEDRVVGLGEDEADDVGRPVVRQVAAVDRADRRRRRPGRSRSRPRSTPSAARTRRTRPARASGSTSRCDWVSLISTSIVGRSAGVVRGGGFGRSAHQAVRCSGYLTRPW